MEGFEVFQIAPRNVMACLYKKDGTNKHLLLQHRLISENANVQTLTLVTPEGDQRVEPGEWIVKQDGDFYKFTEDEFRTMFRPVVAGVSCIFCNERCNNLEKLREHSATCEKHPAVIEKTKGAGASA